MLCTWFYISCSKLVWMVVIYAFQHCNVQALFFPLSMKKVLSKKKKCIASQKSKFLSNQIGMEKTYDFSEHGIITGGELGCSISEPADLLGFHTMPSLEVTEKMWLAALWWKHLVIGRGGRRMAGLVSCRQEVYGFPDNCSLQQCRRPSLNTQYKDPWRSTTRIPPWVPLKENEATGETRSPEMEDWRLKSVAYLFNLDWWRVRIWGMPP